jgi:hypothetical protein
MGNNNLHNTWKSLSFEKNLRSKKEINNIIATKAKQDISKFVAILVVSLIVSIGLLVWLIITSINRQTDLIYLINNFTLGLITIFGSCKGIITWKRLQTGYYNRSVKDWLEERIKLISNETSTSFSRLYYLLIPLLYLLTVLSIHVYFEYKPFVEVINTEESVVGLIVGSILGLVVSFYAVGKIRKYQLRILNSLKELREQILNNE